jgi:hypothetical protein
MPELTDQNVEEMDDEEIDMVIEKLDGDIVEREDPRYA